MIVENELEAFEKWIKQVNLPIYARGVAYDAWKARCALLPNAQQILSIIDKKVESNAGNGWKNYVSGKDEAAKEINNLLELRV